MMLIRVWFLPTYTAMDCLSRNKVALICSIRTCHSPLFRTGPMGSKHPASLSCCLWRQRRICVEWREYNKGIEYVSVQTVSSMFLVPISATIFRPISQLSIFKQIFLLFTKGWKFNTVSSDIMLVSLTPTGYTALYEQVNTLCRPQLKFDGTRLRTVGEVKRKLANAVGSQYSSHYLGTRCIQHYYRWCRTPRLPPAVDWTDAPHRADLNGLVRFARKTKSGFCACDVTFKMACTTQTVPEHFLVDYVW